MLHKRECVLSPSRLRGHAREANDANLLASFGIICFGSWLHLASFALAVGSNWHHLLWHLALELGILGHHLRKKQMASFASLAMPLCFSGMTPKQMACQSVCSLSNTQTHNVHRLMISLALALALSRALSTYRERQRERASARARASEIERCLS